MKTCRHNDNPETCLDCEADSLSGIITFDLGKEDQAKEDMEKMKNYKGERKNIVIRK